MCVQCIYISKLVFGISLNIAVIIKVDSMTYMGRRVRTGVQVGLAFHCSSKICLHQLALTQMPQLYETHLSCLAKRRRMPQTLSITNTSIGFTLNWTQLSQFSLFLRMIIYA